MTLSVKLFILLIAALGQLQEAQSATCSFENHQSANYICRIVFQNIDSENDMQIDGVHADSLNNSHVTFLAQRLSTFQVFPSLIIDQFVNLRLLSLGLTEMRLFNSPITNCENLEQVSISGNYISSIPAGIFRNCRNLRLLHISQNNINRIDVNAFIGLSNLQSLALGGNRLNNVNFQWFLPLPVLTSLSLFENQIKTWNSSILANNPRITALSLDFNLIETLDVDVFSNLPNLEFLSVGNLIETIPTLQNVPNLKFLSMSHNRVRSVSVDQFRNMPNLTNLVLNNNRIETINFSMGDEKVLSNLEELSLNNNNITELPNNTFTSLVSLRRLELNDNQISHLNANSFQPIEQLRELFLSRNRIATVERNFLANATRLELRVGGNICINNEIAIFEGITERQLSKFDECFRSTSSKIEVIVALVPVLTLLIWNL